MDETTIISHYIEIPTRKQREIISRILKDLDDFMRQNPQRRREDVAVIMTKYLFYKLGGVTPAPGEVTRFCGHPVRIMDGAGLEWFITAIRGFVLEEDEA